MELAEIRRKLDGIDASLRELFVQRLTCSAEVAAAKLAADQTPAGQPDTGVRRVCAPGREAEILSRVCEGLPAETARAVREQFAGIMRNSRGAQYEAFVRAGRDGLPAQEEPLPKRRVILQGAPGAYQHIAAQKLFPGLPVVFCESFEDVFAALDGESAGVLPLENSTAGVVGDVFDALSGREICVNGGIELNISHALLGRGALAEVDTVLAHPQALKQCEGFLREHGLRGVPCTNNAVAAKMVAESDTRNVAAVCSEECAEIYHLQVLRRGISDAAGNTTRFVVLGTRFERVPDADKLALLFRTANRPGALAEVLAVFALYGINVLALHSRPVKETPFEYRFYVEFSGKYGEPAVRALLAQLSCELPYCRILGTF